MLVASGAKERSLRIMELPNMINVSGLIITSKLAEIACVRWNAIVCHFMRVTIISVGKWCFTVLTKPHISQRSHIVEIQFVRSWFHRTEIVVWHGYWFLRRWCCRCVLCHTGVRQKIRGFISAAVIAFVFVIILIIWAGIAFQWINYDHIILVEFTRLVLIV